MENLKSQIKDHKILKRMYKLFTLTFFCTLNVISQELITNNSSLQSGFYRDYSEMKTNNPNIKKTYSVKEGREYTGGFMGIRPKINYYRFKITRKEAKEVGAIFGYSDGKNIYIRPGLRGDNALERRFRLSRERRANFRELEIIGKYGYYQDLFKYTTGLKLNIEDHTIIDHVFVFIDFENDNFIQMNYKRVKILLKKDRELWKKFKNDSKKRKNISKYIKEYIIKNKDL